MGLFIRKVSVAIAFVITFYALIAIFFAGGKTDPFYLRFTSKKQNSLIVGTSRAAQGIVPSVVNKMLSNNHGLPIYNFSFTVGMSPYGPVYLNAIKEKVDPETKNGLFIVTVDPWSIARSKRNINDAPSLFREQRQCLANMFFFNLPVNFEYLIKYYSKGWDELIYSHYEEANMILREDGWLDLQVEMDSTKIIQNSQEKIAYYQKNYLPQYIFSELRYAYLNNTIRYLERFGRVFLVRIPVSKEMRALEDNLMPGFDLVMSKMAQELAVPYFNYQENFTEYETIDGNHLYKDSRIKFSKDLSEKILESANTVTE